MTVEQFVDVLDLFEVTITDDSGNEYLLCKCSDRQVLSAQPHGDGAVLIIFEK